VRLIGAMIAGVVIASSGARASPGCSALNGSTHGDTKGLVGTGFSAGDKIAGATLIGGVMIRDTTVNSSFPLLCIAGVNGCLANANNYASYTVPADTPDTIEVNGGALFVPVKITCTPGVIQRRGR
jgi:hypothetical protein